MKRSQICVCGMVCETFTSVSKLRCLECKKAWSARHLHLKVICCELERSTYRIDEIHLGMTCFGSVQLYY